MSLGSGSLPPLRPNPLYPRLLAPCAPATPLFLWWHKYTKLIPSQMFCACCSLCWKHSSPRSSSSCHFLLTQVSAETSLSQSFLALHAFSPPLSLTLPFYIFSPSCWFIYCQSLSCLTAPSGIMRSKKTRSIHSVGLGIKLGVKKCLLNE